MAEWMVGIPLDQGGVLTDDLVVLAPEPPDLAALIVRVSIRRVNFSGSIKVGERVRGLPYDTVARVLDRKSVV